MKIRRILQGLSLILFSLSLASCTSGEGSEIGKDLIKKDVKLNVISDEYKVTDDVLTSYFFENGHVPMIGIKELVQSLDGYYAANVLVSDIGDTTAKFSWSDGSMTYYFKLDAVADTIITNTESFFGFVNAPTGISYDRNYKYAGGLASETEDIVYELKPYDFDIVIKDKDVLLPYTVINTLALSSNIANLYYNGEEYNLFTTYLDSLDDFDKTRNPKLSKTTLPIDVLKERNNGLYFIMDYFYGLKKVKKIDSFKNFIQNDKVLSNAFNSRRYGVSEEAYVKLFITALDDPHTSISARPYYSSYDPFDSNKNVIPYYYEDLGPRLKNMLMVNDALLKNYAKTFNNEYQPVRYSGTTAFIKFDEFKVGYDEEIYDENKNVKPDAWKYDTFYFMKHALDEVRSKGGVKNVVIDLTTNGGGVLAGCISALGFLTDEDIVLPSTNTLSGVKILESYKVDANDDGSFDDKDAYSEFKFYVLTSKYTFSAANYFTSVCKDMGIATIISEENSGGGMCAVSQTALIDGTPINYSGSFALASAKKDKNGEYQFSEIETGIAPDIKCPFDRYYDLAYLNKLINSK